MYILLYWELRTLENGFLSNVYNIANSNDLPTDLYIKSVKNNGYCYVIWLLYLFYINPFPLTLKSTEVF